ncbi:hypothetical protein [Caballeronia temeraria]|nr:hypothetical protein [Caballeronia temeraria]
MPLEIHAIRSVENGDVVRIFASRSLTVNDQRRAMFATNNGEAKDAEIQRSILAPNVACRITHLTYQVSNVSMGVCDVVPKRNPSIQVIGSLQEIVQPDKKLRYRRFEERVGNMP